MTDRRTPDPFAGPAHGALPPWEIRVMDHEWGIRPTRRDPGEVGWLAEEPIREATEKDEAA